MIASRRRFLFGAATSLIAAPAIVRVAANLMPISSRADNLIIGDPGRLALLQRSGRHWRPVWSALPDELVGLGSPYPPDLFVRLAVGSMHAPVGIKPDDLKFVSDREVRFHMDAQGMRDRNVILTTAESLPYDSFRGIRLEVI